MKEELIQKVIKGMVILKNYDGTTSYAVQLINGKRVIMTVYQLLSLRLSMAKITEATGRLYYYPDQDGWISLVRELLSMAKEEKVLKYPEITTIKDILSQWLTQWLTLKDSEPAEPFDRLKKNCVVESGVMFFKPLALQDELRFRGAGVGRSILCRILVTLGAKQTEPRRRFNGHRIRTWEIPTSVVRKLKK